MITFLTESVLRAPSFPWLLVPIWQKWQGYLCHGGISIASRGFRIEKNLFQSRMSRRIPTPSTVGSLRNSSKMGFQSSSVNGNDPSHPGCIMQWESSLFYVKWHCCRWEYQGVRLYLPEHPFRCCSDLIVSGDPMVISLTSTFPSMSSDSPRWAWNDCRFVRDGIFHPVVWFVSSTR